jgi:hypothetical protein
MTNASTPDSDRDASRAQDSLSVLRSGKATMGPSQKNATQESSSEPAQSLEECPERTNTSTSTQTVHYDVIAHLRRLPARLSIFDALQLSKEFRDALIQALANKEVWEACFADFEDSTMCAETITFTDDDMMLGDVQHNRPLFVSSPASSMVSE